MSSFLLLSFFTRSFRGAWSNSEMSWPSSGGRLLTGYIWVETFAWPL